MFRKVASYVGLPVSGAGLVYGLFVHASVSIMAILIIIMMVAFYSIVDLESPQKKICNYCGGSGSVPAVGAWVTEYDDDPCPRCGGSGKVLQQSSPFEEDGYCMKEDDL